jgi:hypothetical protein
MVKPDTSEVFYVIIAEIAPDKWSIVSDAVTREEAVLLVRDQWKLHRRARMISSD